ncbi:hypothetical protein [Corynebacterium aquilae]|uniref:hypothetical protein n=1 Tax=Corynebacterium aquilae TaxID=203263 RepID=UPI000952FF61|nr:hypothetical protein [Corynebacterium aquilae]
MFTHDEAQALVERICGVDGVAGMHRGRFGEVAMLFPGDRVGGIRLIDDVLDVHVVADTSAKRNLFEVAADVEAAARAAGASNVLVTFGDAA